MGCSPSRLGLAGKKESIIDRKLSEALNKNRNRNDRKHHTLNELLLQFPRMKTGFKRCREVFSQVDENRDGLVDAREFRQHCRLFGLEPNDPLIAEIYDAADMDGSTAIDRMELVLVFIIIHLLHPEKSAQMDKEIRKALEIVEKAFNCFDVSHDGSLQQGEIYNSMMDGQQPASNTKQVSDNLFAQLDWDGSGSISIREFLFGLERMVMEEDESP